VSLPVLFSIAIAEGHQAACESFANEGCSKSGHQAALDVALQTVQDDHRLGGIRRIEAFGIFHIEEVLVVRLDSLLRDLERSCWQTEELGS
jgi:hypothetical protein